MRRPIILPKDYSSYKQPQPSFMLFLKQHLLSLQWLQPHLFLWKGLKNRTATFAVNKIYGYGSNVLVYQQREIIIDFKVVKGYNCPQQYQQYSNYSWPGNIQGCFCKISVGLFEYEVVMKGRCSQRQFLAGCLSVPQNQYILFQFWQPESHLCIKRLKNYNFYASLANIVNPQGYAIKNCSDSTNYQIDLIQPIPCPVTNMVHNFSLNQSILSLNFSYSREGQYPLVYFRLSEHNFCENFSDNDISPGRKSNYILQKNYKYQCNTIDSRTILLSSQGQSTLYNNNPKISYITSTLPSYPQLSNDFIYQLGFVRYPAWTYACRNSSAYSLIATKSYLNLSTIQSTFNMLVMLAAISSSAGFIFIAYYLVKVYLYFKVKDMHGYLYLKDYQIKKVNPHTNIVKDRQTQIIKSLIFQLSPILSVLFLVLLYINLYSHKGWFQSAYACTSGSFIQYLQGYNQFIGEQMVTVITSIFVNMALICLDASYLLWRCFKGDLEQEQQEDQQQIHSISKPTSEQVSMVNDVHFPKQIANTEECLIQNTFNYNQDNRRINIINIDDDQLLQEDNGSQYSQSSKKSD